MNGIVKSADTPYRSQPALRRSSGNGHVREASKNNASAVLGELATLASDETAAGWAREALDSKNSLTAADAKQLEDAF
jgi:hypothetical protein